ncbi:MAG: xylan 1,4-beta-xylosidase [Oscillospiraceae bacterium]|nr:xylan 1,4-beta-xylosidase [Oscillospiraceae bacterium]
MAKDDRFITRYEQGGILNDTMQVIVDRKTGVNYLFIRSGYAGGLTPLLDREGKPVITPIPTED